MRKQVTVRLVLRREAVRPHLARVTVAPITTTIRGLSTEIVVGPRNGLDRESVVSCGNLVTVPVSSIGRRIGSLLATQETELATAIQTAFDLV